MGAEPLLLTIQHPDGRTETRPLEGGRRLVVGRKEACDICLPYESVSSQHLEVWAEESACYVLDLGSLNGTRVDGHGIVPHQARSIRPGQVVDLIGAKLIISSGAALANRDPAAEAPCDLPPLDEKLLKIKAELHERLLKEFDLTQRSKTEQSEDLLKEDVKKELLTFVEKVPSASLPRGFTRDKLVEELLHDIFGLGPLEKLLSDATITEIMVNGPKVIFVERKGTIARAPLQFLSEKHLLDVIERILAPLGKTVNVATPMADARLADGSRVNVIIKPTSLIGPVMTIRKFPERTYTIDDLVRFGSLRPPVADFLGLCVAKRKNVIVSGGTGSGKTTLLNVLSTFIPARERIVTIEDTAELRLNQPHVVPLEARAPNIEGKGEITIRDMVRNALRMRPDRIIVGECRSGETLDMLQAMNTGHDGSLTTVHANSPRDVISRLETMVLMSSFELPIPAIRRQIASAIDVIVQQQRFSSDGSRKITHVTEITGMEGDQITTQDIFLFEQTGIGASGEVEGRFISTGIVPTFIEELRRSGTSIPFALFAGGPLE